MVSDKNWIKVIVFGTFIGLLQVMSTLSAQPLAVGGGGGVIFPFAHRDRLSEGFSLEAFYRLDPYEVRFQYADMNEHHYFVTLNRKHFFADSEIRPFLEAGLGPAIANTANEGLSYGVSPQVGFGADLAINAHLSTGVTTRYIGMVYFGDTPSGVFEAQHSLSIVGNLILWF